MAILLNSDTLINVESLYWFAALGGSGLFAIQLLLNLFGIADHGATDAHPGQDGQDFKCISIQSITGFLMMFGWAAITCQKEFGLTTGPVIFFALLAGIFSFFVTSSIFRLAKKLHSSGTVFNVDDAVGLQAQVYQRIPGNGIGKISVSLQQMSREIDAISHKGEEIPSFTYVQIIKKKDDNTVVVTTL